jgi:hypothetical protein
MHTIAGAAVLVMALAGCNDEDTGAPGNPQEGSNSSASAKPDVPATGQPGDPEQPTSDGGDPGKPGSGDANASKPLPGEPLSSKQIDASGLPKNHPKKVTVNGAKLTITAQESGCQKAAAELGKQDSSQVVVTLVVTEPAEAQMCTMDIRFPPLTVELDEPIGKRTLVLEHEMRKG